MLTDGAQHWLLSSAQLGSLLTFTPRLDPLVGPQLDVHIDASRLPAVLGQVTAAISTAPQDARFVVQGDKVHVVPSKDGIRVDVTALAPLIASHTHGAVIPVPTQHYPPVLTTAKAAGDGHQYDDSVSQHLLSWLKQRTIDQYPCCRTTSGWPTDCSRRGLLLQ